MRKAKWQNQFKALPNQSDFHEKVREIFCKDPFFAGLSCYQEVFLKDLIEDYEYGNYRYDWYISNIGVIIELHGSQHYKVTSFGGSSYEKTRKDFILSKTKDLAKKEAAIEAGFKYVEIPYKMYKKLDAVQLKKMILE